MAWTLDSSATFAQVHMPRSSMLSQLISRLYATGVQKALHD